MNLYFIEYTAGVKGIYILAGNFETALKKAKELNPKTMIKSITHWHSDIVIA